MHFKFKKVTQSIPFPPGEIPIGVWLICDHDGACKLTDTTLTVPAVVSLIPATPWGVALATAIILQAGYIRKLNESSGGKGVKIKFIFSVGVITDVKRRGKGESPCADLIPGRSIRERTGVDAIRSLDIYTPTSEDLMELEKLEKETAEEEGVE